MDTLRGRLILSHIAPALVITPLVTLVLIFVLESQIILVNLTNQLIRQANLLAEAAADHPNIWDDAAQANAFVARFQPRMSAQLMLLDHNGRVLASGRDDADWEQGDVLELPHLQVVLAGQQSSATDYSYDPGAEIADVLVPILGSEQQVLGVVRVTHRLSTVAERFQRLRSYILQVLSVGLVLGIGVGYLLAVTLERPLERLTGAIYRLASGEQLDQLPERGGPVEFQTLAAAFNSLVERLHVLQSARRQLLANLIHEIGRPLGALRAANWSLLSGADEDVQLRSELLHGIDSELRTLQRLLDDLAQNYNQPLSSLDLGLQMTSLSDWLTVVLVPWRAAAQQQELNWQTNLPPDLPTVRIDPDRLAQALGNLLSNAIKYTPRYGTVQVSAGVGEEMMWIRISDTGPGVAPEEQGYIFEPFSRSRVQERQAEGMGLGLTIARDLVQAHGGRLELESQPNRGSRFTLFLPLEL